MSARRDEHGSTVSIEEARGIVLCACTVMKPTVTALEDALGRVLGESVVSRVELPRFTHSAMDGYAVRAADLAAAPVRLAVVGAVMAGDDPGFVVGPGQAARIMTGAPLPAGSDAVCMIERTRAEGEDHVVIDATVAKGDNVRVRGEDLGIGTEVFAPGATVTPAHLGVLESLGLEEVVVHPLPRVGVLSTGDELVSRPQRLGPGKIRDANRPSLLAQLRRDGYGSVDLGTVPDELGDVTALLRVGDQHCDAIVVSGGVSVGDRDVVRFALEAVGAETARWLQVASKPSKPFAFGTFAESGTPVFGLPGNPVAALVSYELFVRPALRFMSGHTELDRPRFAGVTDVDLPRRRDGKVHLLRVHAEIGADGRLHVRTSGGQGSHMLRALADANGLAVLPDGNGARAGDIVEVLLLDADRLATGPPGTRA